MNVANECAAGCPALITVAFLIVRLKVDDYLCWNSFVNESLIWILLAPIELTLFVNSVLFIRLVRELFIKMRNSSTPDLDKHKYLQINIFILLLQINIL